MLKQTMKPEDKIYFVDATHPQHNNMHFYGWIYKGDIKTIKANSARKRLNLNGALDIETLDIKALSEKKIHTGDEAASLTRQGRHISYCRKCQIQP